MGEVVVSKLAPFCSCKCSSVFRKAPGRPVEPRERDLSHPTTAFPVGVLGAFYRARLSNAVKHPIDDKTLYTFPNRRNAYASAGGQRVTVNGVVLG